jgi:AraC-like DNA-binding protein
MFGFTTMFDAGIRGGAIVLLVLLAITGWRFARHEVAARYTVLFDVCAIAYLVETAPPVANIHPWWIIPFRMLSMATPAVFQLWAAATFDDEFVPAWWRWVPFFSLLSIAAWAILSDWSVVWRIAQLAALLLAFVGIWTTLSGRKADLVERRRQLRIILAIVVGVWIVGLTSLGAIASDAVRAAGSVACAGGVLALALAAALLRLRVETLPSGSGSADPAVPPRSTPSDGISPQEQELLDRLTGAMNDDRLYREEALGITGLAARLAIPEYRLRRLINGHLGFRNFTSFVNSYRLAEAMAALADPSQAEVPVLTIALDAGFQSIGPFNRAFKTLTGVTPTTFRRDPSSRLANF